MLNFFAQKTNTGSASNINPLAIPAALFEEVVPSPEMSHHLECLEDWNQSSRKGILPGGGWLTGSAVQTCTPERSVAKMSVSGVAITM